VFPHPPFPTLLKRRAAHRLVRRPALSPALSAGLASTFAALTLTAFSAAPAGAATAGAAPAGGGLVSTGACNEATLSQPFARWGDATTYELVPGGDFEGPLSGWTLAGGATRVAGSEPYGVTGSIGFSSLALSAGASAQSPFVCVNASYPTFRFFARNSGLLSTVLVQVVYKTPLGQVALPLGTVALSGEWQPTLPMLTGSVVVGAVTGGTAQAALRFTALTGSSRIDDVYLDPRMR
jgi:hypothetical protein